MSLSTHVLDAALGRPAAGVELRLERDLQVLATTVTDADGRAGEFGEIPAGTYTLTFDTGAYHAATGQQGFYPEVAITFAVTDATQHHHVPLLLSPFAYSTYRGS